MKNLLLNPFERFAGSTALIIGIVIISVTAWVAWLGHIHLDGPIDLHAGANTITPARCIAEALTDWLSLAVFLYASGMIFSKSSIRLIDVLGTQAMARFPYLIATVFSSLLFSNKITGYIEFKVMHRGAPVEITAADGISFAFMTLILLVCLVWMIVWMYRAYSVSCNLKGSKGIVSFIVCLLLAEIASSIILSKF